MTTFTFRGYSSADMGVIVSVAPPVIRAQLRDTAVEVPGAHGNLHFSMGTYDEILLPIECTLIDNTKLDVVSAWLTGNGWLTVSTEPDRAYKARVINQIPFNRVLEQLNIRSFTVIFTCFPFRYTFPITYQTLLTGATIVNPTTLYSEPKIVVNGTGDITLNIGSYTIGLTGVDGSITIDSEIGEAYKSTVSQNGKMTGEFPLLLPGNNAVSWNGSVTSVVITHNWRWI